MKRLIGITLAVIMGLSISTLCSGADSLDTSKSISVTLEVPEMFGMQIWDTEYTQTIEPLNVMDTERMLGKLHIYVTTNKGVPWQIDAKGTPCTSTENPGVRANLMISTYGVQATAPVSGEIVTDLVLSETSQPIYTASADEINRVGFLIHGLFAVAKDDLTQLTQGTYTGGIELTLTPLAP